ncbi:MAG TPA: hypothetical protein PLO37_19120 [Candidatus Hydrogenedentes bacterium]|nr:hypothetical protein [Candidatus Hydrogenedentota bacterium]HPG68964.1 hypothetical protein [Candidatus Hydrogenedentota bacterium]
MKYLEPILEHMKDHTAAYVGGAVAVLLLLILFRRVLVPLVLKTFEIAIYLVITHFVTAAFVLLVSAFKGATSMEALGRRDRNPNPNWKIPWIEVWDTKQFSPEWLLYVEMGLAIAVVAIVWYLRPPAFRHKDAGKPVAKEKTTYQSARDRAAAATRRAAAKAGSKRGSGRRKGKR